MAASTVVVVVSLALPRPRSRTSSCKQTGQFPRCFFCRFSACAFPWFFTKKYVKLHCLQHQNGGTKKQKSLSNPRGLPSCNAHTRVRVCFLCNGRCCACGAWSKWPTAWAAMFAFTSVSWEKRMRRGAAGDEAEDSAHRLLPVPPGLSGRPWYYQVKGNNSGQYLQKECSPL